MLQDFRKHNLGANSVFKIRIKSERFFCKLMAEEVFVFFNTQGSNEPTKAHRLERA